MKIAVIGGGPAGMMAAFFAAQNHKVTLYEKNEKLGKKLFITGKGRCNFTNDCTVEEMLAQIIRNPKFLYSALYSMPKDRTLEILEEYGVHFKVERGGRVFPASDKSSDLIKAYQKMLRNRNVKVLLNQKVQELEYDDQFIINGTDRYDGVIMATGGITYPGTGSTGDGYRLLKKLGHQIIPLRPGLVPIKLKDQDLLDLQGLSLKNVELICNANDPKKSIREFGEMMFTHFGITGPIVLTLSSKINRLSNIQLHLDLKPALTRDQLDRRLLREFDDRKNKEIKTILASLLPKDLIHVVLNRSQIQSNKPIHQITKEDRNQIVDNLKNFSLQYAGLHSLEAGIITSGGVDISEINPSTMESKIIPNLYICGEVLDIDALTGGYNIQIANSTGYLAGSSIKE
ncbi:MAG: aminoacetone oxidase family FAD-binding enzyme [Tissierellia bacterium]|nr:aminoacetone oxidase family FAD-binding enzyme [Tissierellia bacterium]